MMRFLFATVAAGALLAGGPVAARGADADVAAVTAIVKAMPHAQDVAALSRDFAPDVTYFDIGKDDAFDLPTFRRKIGAQFAAISNVRTRILDLKVHAAAGMAYAVSTQNFLADAKGGGPIDLIFRETDVFEKRGGKWWLVHQHLSVPVDLVAGKALLEDRNSIPPGGTR